MAQPQGDSMTSSSEDANAAAAASEEAYSAG